MTKEITKLLSYIVLTLLFVISDQNMTEQITQPATQNSRNTMIVSPAHDQSPFDLNHMGVDSGKSDRLSMPYYDMRDL